MVDASSDYRSPCEGTVTCLIHRDNRQEKQPAKLPPDFKGEALKFSSFDYN